MTINLASSSTIMRLLLVLGMVSTMTACQTYSTRRVEFKNHPIALYVVSKLSEDEETLDYMVKFRNTGREVLSFDYTLADEPGVPHVDSLGPRSGLVENLYPGDEVEVPNPTKRMTIYATLGTVSYGKRTKDDLAAIYKPDDYRPPGMDQMQTGDPALVPPLPSPAPLPSGT
jgi:hypothetical protein